MEEYIDILIEFGLVEEAAEKLASLLSAPYVSPKGTTAEQLWKKLIELLTDSGLTFERSLYAFTKQTCKFPVEVILRAGLTKLKHQVGWIWVCLANYFVRLSLFEKVCIHGCRSGCGCGCGWLDTLSFCCFFLLGERYL